MVMKTQVMGVYSEFVSLVTLSSALQSFKCVCVWSMDTRAYTQSSLSVFTTLGTAVLFCVIIPKTRLVSSILAFQRYE